MRVVASRSLRGIALAAAAAACFAPAIARADSPFALRLGMYGSTDSQSRTLADNKGFVVGVQYQLAGVPAVLNGESWSTIVSADYLHMFTDKQIRFQGVPVSINQIYTFEEQSGKTPYAGFSLTAITYKSKLVQPIQPWVTRFGAGLILGLNLNGKMFVEGRYEMYDKYSAAGAPNGFRALFGYRF